MFYHYAERCFNKMKKFEVILDFLVMANPPSLTSDLDGMRLEDAVGDFGDTLDNGEDTDEGQASL